MYNLKPIGPYTSEAIAFEQNIYNYDYDDDYYNIYDADGRHKSLV